MIIAVVGLSFSAMICSIESQKFLCCSRSSCLCGAKSSNFAMNSLMNSFRVPKTGRNSSDIMGSIVSLFVPTCVGSYRYQICGESSHKLHLGTLTPQPHLRSKSVLPPEVSCIHLPTTQGRLKSRKGLFERQHVSSLTSIRSQKRNC